MNTTALGMANPTGQASESELEMVTVGQEGAPAAMVKHTYTRLAPHLLLSVSSHPPSLVPHNRALSDPAPAQLLSTKAKRSARPVNSPLNGPAAQTLVRSYPYLRLPLQLMSCLWILHWTEERAALQCACHVLDPTEQHVRETVGAGAADDAVATH